MIYVVNKKNIYICALYKNLFHLHGHIKCELKFLNFAGICWLESLLGLRSTERETVKLSPHLNWLSLLASN